MLIRGKIEREDLVYAACAFECEGSITFSRSITSKGWYQITPFVSIANVDDRLVNWLQSKFGGHILTEQPKKLSKRVIYRWKVYSGYCVDFLNLVLPYLKFKQDRVKLVIDFWANRSTLSRTQKDNYWLRLKALNKGESPAETKRNDAETNLQSDSPTLVETPVSL
jgi:hypothetical protein